MIDGNTLVVGAQVTFHLISVNKPIQEHNCLCAYQRGP